MPLRAAAAPKRPEGLVLLPLLVDGGAGCLAGLPGGPFTPRHLQADRRE